MLNLNDIMETINMIQEEDLDIRTITMGISLLDCADTDIDKSCEKVYNKIYSKAKNLVEVGETISKKYGIPIVNKRVSVTPISMLVAVGLGPVTGQPLPLISRGGTSVLITSIYFGIMMGVSREQTELRERVNLTREESATDAPIVTLE